MSEPTSTFYHRKGTGTVVKKQVHRKKNYNMKFCECGCGTQIVEYNKHSKKRRFAKDHVNKGKVFSEEHKRKIGDANRGENNHNYGKHLSEETKKKMSEAQKGENNHNYGKAMSEEQKIKLSGAQKGENSHMWGKERSPETRRKISEAHTGKEVSEGTRKKLSLAQKGKTLSEETRRKMGDSRRGEKNGNWNNGSSFVLYCSKFNNQLKEKVRNRDNRTCQNCAVKENGSKHDIHHIHYDKENCYPDLITVCRSCNAKANGDRNYWEKLYMNKLNDRGLLLWTQNNED